MRVEVNVNKDGVTSGGGQALLWGTSGKVVTGTLLTLRLCLRF